MDYCLLWSHVRTSFLIKADAADGPASAAGAKATLTTLSSSSKQQLSAAKAPVKRTNKKEAKVGEGDDAEDANPSKIQKTDIGDTETARKPKGRGKGRGRSNKRQA